MSMRRILMCLPSHFRVFYQINPWMITHEPVDPVLASNQWNQLKSTLEKVGAEVEVLDPQIDGKNLPDLVFTANAALIRGKTAYLANFYHNERKAETDINKKWFLDHEYNVREDDLIFEGAGDALFAGDKLFAAYGIRTDLRVYDKIVKAFSDEEPFKIINCQLVDQRFYHIDTAFCPLNEEVAIWFPKAFHSKSAEKMKKELELLPVSEQEASQFACNAVAVGNDVILPNKNEEIAKLLEKNGFKTHFVDVSEFMKAGGACKCMTLRI